MASLTKAQKIEFARQIVKLLKKEKDRLMEKGVDVTAIIERLELEIADYDNKQATQTEAKAAAKEATKEANASLKVAYKDASSSEELFAGAFGKDSELVKVINNIRDAMANEAARGKKDTTA